MMGSPMIDDEQCIPNGIKKAGENFGIVAMEIYFPALYVSQAELESFDGVSPGKYTKGLGQTNMSVCTPLEDIHSLCLNVVSRLLSRYNIPYAAIGRLEVGTETLLDKSKSVKSVIMELFNKHHCYDVEGADVKNACYGGVAAFFNTIAWLESSSWDGRYGLVVAGDIAIYEPGPARPTGGAGAVAMLLGPDAPIVSCGPRASYMKHIYDFYKPNMDSDFPIVDGKLSLDSYFEALISCYRTFLKKSGPSCTNSPLMSHDYYLFHAPFGKLVQKSLALLYHYDTNAGHLFSGKSIENEMIEKSYEVFCKKTLPSLLCSREIGNTYCGSLFSGLLSLICCTDADILNGKKLLLFGYGSGCCSTIFELKIRSSVAHIAKTVSLPERLSRRHKISPLDYTKLIDDRKNPDNLKFSQFMDADSYRLASVDASGKRSYFYFK